MIDMNQPKLIVTTARTKNAEKPIHSKGVLAIRRKVDELNSLAWKKRYSNKVQALELCSQAAELSTSGDCSDGPYKKGLGAALAISGFVYRLMMDLDRAVQYANRALEVLDQVPNQKAHFDAHVTLTLAFLFIGDINSCLKHAILSQEMAGKIKDPERKAHLFSAMGTLYYTIKDFDTSLSFYDKAIKKANRAQSPEILMGILQNRANVLRELKNLDEALRDTEKAVAMAGSLHMHHEEAVYMAAQAEILVRSGEYSEAQQILERALASLTRHQITAPFPKIAVLLIRSRCRQAQNDYETAAIDLEQAYDLAQAGNIRLYEMYALELRAENFEHRQMMEQALDCLKKSKALYDSLRDVKLSSLAGTLKAGQTIQHTQKQANHLLEKYQKMEKAVEENKNLILLTELIENLGFEQGAYGILAHMHHGFRFDWAGFFLKDQEDLTPITTMAKGDISAEDLQDILKISNVESLLQETIQRAETKVFVSGDLDGTKIPGLPERSRILFYASPAFCAHEVKGLIAFLKVLRKSELDLYLAELEGMGLYHTVFNRLLLNQQKIEDHKRKVEVNLRRRISRDLHDSVLQSLNSIVLTTRNMRSQMDKQGNQKDSLDLLEMSAQQLLKEMRLLIYEMDPEAHEKEGMHNLVDMLKKRLESVEKRAGLCVDLVVDPQLDFPLEWNKNLYMIASEALNNSIKHARASCVQVKLASINGGLLLEVSDDGIGFDRTKVNPNYGMGLQNLQTRSQEIGGELQIHSQISGGTRISLQVGTSRTTPKS